MSPRNYLAIIQYQGLYDRLRVACDYKIHCLYPATSYQVHVSCTFNKTIVLHVMLPGFGRLDKEKNKFRNMSENIEDSLEL